MQVLRAQFNWEVAFKSTLRYNRLLAKAHGLLSGMDGFPGWGMRSDAAGCQGDELYSDSQGGELSSDEGATSAREDALRRPSQKDKLFALLTARGATSSATGLLESKPMKINMHEFNEHLAGLADRDPAVRQKAVSGLAKYSFAEWQGTPDAVTAAVAVLVSASPHRSAASADGAFRAEAAKALGNIGTQSPAVLPELRRLLQHDADDRVRAEAARALGKIGEGAGTASQALAAVLGDPHAGDMLRGVAAWALGRVSPLAAGTAPALGAAAGDRSGHVGVCAAEALWKVSGEDGWAVLRLAARLGDPAVCHAAAQALYRIGAGAKEAVPALLAAAKTKDRLFRELVIMALRKIDPTAATKAGLV